MRLSCLWLLLPLTAHAQTLYNETLGNFPGDQGWFLYFTNSPPNATQTYLSGLGTQLVTVNTVSAGYFNENPFTGALINPAFPILNRTPGFRISWDLTVNSETHSSNDRAGFSIIALANDNKGIELGFWTNEIWAQNDSPLFTHGEGVSFSTTSRIHYDLNLIGSNYSLYANGNAILNGTLRDYTNFGIPYTYTNFLFLGDDTSSANADITLGRVTLTAAVPEPATWITLACLCLGAAFVWCTTRKAKPLATNNFLERDAPILV